MAEILFIQVGTSSRLIDAIVIENALAMGTEIRDAQRILESLFTNPTATCPDVNAIVYKKGNNSMAYYPNI